MNNLEALDTARNTLAHEKHTDFYNYLLGALSVFTSPTDWKDAIDSAMRCMATYSTPDPATQCAYDVLYDDRSASDAVPHHFLDQALQASLQNGQLASAVITIPSAEIQNKLIQDMADKRARALTEALGVTVEAWRSPDTGQWELVRSTDGVLVELWESL